MAKTVDGSEETEGKDETCTKETVSRDGEATQLVSVAVVRTIHQDPGLHRMK